MVFITHYSGRLKGLLGGFLYAPLCLWFSLHTKQSPPRSSPVVFFTHSSCRLEGLSRWFSLRTCNSKWLTLTEHTHTRRFLLNITYFWQYFFLEHSRTEWFNSQANNIWQDRQCKYPGIDIGGKQATAKAAIVVFRESLGTAMLNAPKTRLTSPMVCYWLDAGTQVDAATSAPQCYQYVMARTSYNSVTNALICKG